jgi:hypothetical protein
MKASIDIPDKLYRQLKAKCALEGRSTQEVAVNLFETWVHEERAEHPAEQRAVRSPDWFGALHGYAVHADG